MDEWNPIEIIRSMKFNWDSVLIRLHISISVLCTTISLLQMSITYSIWVIQSSIENSIFKDLFFLLFSAQYECHESNSLSTRNLLSLIHTYILFDVMMVLKWLKLDVYLCMCMCSNHLSYQIVKINQEHSHYSHKLIYHNIKMVSRKLTAFFFLSLLISATYAKYMSVIDQSKYTLYLL